MSSLFVVIYVAGSIAAFSPAIDTDQCIATSIYANVVVMEYFHALEEAGLAPTAEQKSIKIQCEDRKRPPKVTYRTS